MAENKPALIGLAHVGIFTKDIEASIRFYTDYLGFEVTHRSVRGTAPEITRLALIRLGSCVVELIQPSDLRRVNVGVRGSVDHLAIEASGVEGLIKQLRAKGLEFDGDMFISPGLFGGVKGIFFKGPSGEVLELFEYTK